MSNGCAMTYSLVVQFYKRNGFAVGNTIKGYYKRLTPSDAIVLSKQLDQL